MKIKILKKITLLLLILTTIFCVAGCKEKKAPAIPKGKLMIKTNPSGAKINYAGKVIGITPKEITANPKFYTVKITKDGYYDKLISFNVKVGENPMINVALEQVKSSVLVESKPTGANVSIGGKIVGLTPCVIKDLSYGKHDIIFTKSGYSRKLETIEINNARPKKVIGSLTSNIGLVEIDSSPEGAEIYINGDLIGITPLKKEIEDGEYDLEIRKNNYHNIIEKVIVERGKSKNLNYDLNLLSSVIKVNSSIDNATVYLNNELVGKTPYVIENLVPRKEYVVRVENENYTSASQTIRAAAGKTHELNFNMIRNVGDAEFVINPPGVTVYVDGNRYGVTEEGETKDLSKVFTIKDLKPGLHVVKVYHKRAKPDTIARRFEVLPDEVVRVPEIKLWVPNAEIIMKDGSRELGIIVSRNDDYIYFEANPNMRFSIRHHNIEKINKLDDEE